MQKPILLGFDVSNLFHRAYSVYQQNIPGFNIEDVKYQDMLVRKFITDTCSLIKLVKPENVTYCFDGQSFRKHVSVEYKANRSSKGDAFFKTMDGILNLLKYKNLNAYKNIHLEADDYLGLVAQEFQEQYNIVLVSADEDIRQLVTKNVIILAPASNQKKIYVADTDETWYTEFSSTFTVQTVNPLLTLVEKVLKGCEGDNIFPLAPKGYRTKKLEAIADQMSPLMEIMDHKGAFQKSLRIVDETLFLALNEKQITKQFALVCLRSKYIPKDFQPTEQLTLIDVRPLELTFNSILENTRYFDVNYKN